MWSSVKLTHETCLSHTLCKAESFYVCSHIIFKCGKNMVNPWVFLLWWVLIHYNLTVICCCFVTNRNLLETFRFFYFVPKIITLIPLNFKLLLFFWFHQYIKSVHVVLLHSCLNFFLNNCVKTSVKPWQLYSEWPSLTLRRLHQHIPSAHKGIYYISLCLCTVLNVPFSVKVGAFRPCRFSEH